VCSKHRQEGKGFGCGQASMYPLFNSIVSGGKKKGMMSGWAAKVRKSKKQGARVRCTAARVVKRVASSLHLGLWCASRAYASKRTTSQPYRDQSGWKRLNFTGSNNDSSLAPVLHSPTGLDYTAPSSSLPCRPTSQMPGLPPARHRLLLLLLFLLFVLATSTLSSPSTTTAVLPLPSAPFQVPTPYGTLAYKVIEESRVLFLKLTTRARSSYISTTVGPVHFYRCPGKRGASLPPVVLVHGVCATGKRKGSGRTPSSMEIVPFL